MSWTVIVPTCPGRQDVYEKFLEAWNSLFVQHEVTLITIFDGPEAPKYCQGDHVLDWKSVKKAGFKYIPQQTDMVRSFAMWYAYEHTFGDYFLTLDDDVRPLLGTDIFAAYEKVFEEGAVHSNYIDVGSMTSSGLQMRGFPYKDRKKKTVAVQYGGWSGVLDYDAATQLSQPKDAEVFYPYVMPVPSGVAATCCIMNTAWRRSYTPIMWQLPMLNGRYNRVGDIWSGLFIKRVLDELGDVMVINGKAGVYHDRASNPYNSLVKEAPSVWLNDNLWDNLFTVVTDENPDMLEVYVAYTDAAIRFFEIHDREYAEHFKKARDEWVNAWKNRW